MRERGKREQAAAEQLRGWSVVPLEHSDANVVRVGELRLPSRFGGWWRHFEDDAEGEPRATGREVELWLAVRDGTVKIAEVTFRGFDDEFERLGVPAMRDTLTMMFSVFDAGVPSAIAATLKATPVARRERAMRESQRVRRSNAIDYERVADLYRKGGAAAIVAADDVSQATAFRWIKAAREAGVLEERTTK